VKKVLFISSTGGHFTELMELKSLFEKYDYHIVTEKDSFTITLKDKYKDRITYLPYGTRRRFFTYIFKYAFTIIKSIFLYIKLRPKYIVTTGTHTALPICFFGKIFGSKIIFIETFANMNSKTMSGRIIYPITDLFIVQWESMQKIYPKAVLGGSIFNDISNVGNTR
jgi:UDP-N-acetylglucosamine:LPS N-acetylglucosamine transferase